MAWYTTAHAQRDAAQQAEQRKRRDLLDCAVSSKLEVTGYERSANESIADAAQKTEARGRDCK